MESLRLHHCRAGFTLTELLVVVAIIGIIMAIVSTNQGSFNKTLILKNTAYDIALTLRSAESYGLGSRAAGTIANAGYGVHFQNTSPASFTFFADTFPTPNAANCHGLPSGSASMPDAQPGDCIYTSGSGKDQSVSEYALGNGITISDFCARRSNGAWSCKSDANGLSSLDIVFARPNPDPFIRANGDAVTAYTGACIAITSPQGGAKFVSVAASGEITANAVLCP